MREQGVLIAWFSQRHTTQDQSSWCLKSLLVGYGFGKELPTEAGKEGKKERSRARAERRNTINGDVIPSHAIIGIYWVVMTCNDFMVHGPSSWDSTTYPLLSTNFSLPFSFPPPHPTHPTIPANAVDRRKAPVDRRKQFRGRQP